MKNLSFEVHKYAPELSKVFFHGIKLDIKLDFAYQTLQDHKKLVRAVRDSGKFAQPKIACKRIAVIKKVYSEEKHQWLNTTKGGAFSNINTVLDVVDKMYEPQSTLMDGSTLPEPSIILSFGKNGRSHDITKMARKRYNQGKSLKTRK